MRPRSRWRWWTGGEVRRRGIPLTTASIDCALSVTRAADTSTLLRAICRLDTSNGADGPWRTATCGRRRAGISMDQLSIKRPTLYIAQSMRGAYPCIYLPDARPLEVATPAL